MKKRLLILLLAVAMVLCACGKRHEHAFSAEYTSDEEYHWFACECGEKDGYEKHVWNKGSVTLRPTTEKEGELTFTLCAEKEPTAPSHNGGFSAVTLLMGIAALRLILWVLPGKRE